MKLRLPYPPTTNLLYRTVVKGRRAFPIKTAAYREYEGAVRMAMRGASHEPFAKGVTVGVTIHVYRPRRSGDLDNRIKALLDVLHNVAFEDDDQVIEIHAHRHDDKGDPHATVEIWDVLEVPEENQLAEVKS